MGIIGNVVKVFLCLMFFLSGMCKLTPQWDENVYTSMDVAFRERLTPFWQQLFFSEIGLELNASMVKTCFASTEMLCAVLLFTSYNLLAAILLFGLMSFVVLTHVFLQEWSQVLTPLMLCVASLFVCYVGDPPRTQSRPVYLREKTA